MQKFTEAPDRKLERRMPGKRTLLVQKRNSTSLQRYPYKKITSYLLDGCVTGCREAEGRRRRTVTLTRIETEATMVSTR